jgi:signal transduction histidine kinase
VIWWGTEEDRTNLLDDALKFPPEGGEIRVRVSREGSHAVVSVEDTGRGIPPDDPPISSSGSTGPTGPGSGGGAVARSEA